MERQIEHISEEDLERYSAFPETLTDEKRSLIQDHLSECAHCAKELDGVKEFYRQLEEQLKREPIDGDVRLSEALADRRPDKYLQYRGVSRTSRSIMDAAFEIVPYKNALLPRTIIYVKNHPITIGSFTLVLAILLIVLKGISKNVIKGIDKHKSQRRLQTGAA